MPGRRDPLSRRRLTRHRALALLMLLALPLARARAQAERRVQRELRLDAIAARASALHLGIGANVEMGSYLRTGLTAAGGATRLPGGHTVGSGRVDVIGRFLLDPFREFRWGPYAGAGASLLYTRSASPADRDRWRGVVVAVVGVEGSAAGAVRPAVELGLGGGARVGVVLRWGRTERR